MPECGSNGVTVFAPEIPKAKIVLTLRVTVALTVIVSAVSTADEIAYQEYVQYVPPLLLIIVRRPHVKPAVSVMAGGFVVGVEPVVNIRYITSFGLLVVRVVAQEGVQAPFRAALPSSPRAACAGGMEAPNRKANANVANNAMPRTCFMPPDLPYFGALGRPTEPAECRNL